MVEKSAAKSSTAKKSTAKTSQKSTKKESTVKSTTPVETVVAAEAPKKSSKLVAVLICMIAAVVVLAAVIIVLIATKDNGNSGQDNPPAVSDGKDDKPEDKPEDKPKDEKYDVDSVISANSKNGGIADHVKGNEKAKVVIIEYADYQCPGCAQVNPWINAVIKEYGNKVALVYRSFPLSYHANAEIAAAAAEAAGLQGYWEEYANYLFANQSEWEYSSTSEAKKYFAETFEYISDGDGDTKKFKSDMSSDEVAAKIKFDTKLAKKVGVSATPSFYMDGEVLDWYEYSTKDLFMNFMRDKIDEKLAE